MSPEIVYVTAAGASATVAALAIVKVVWGFVRRIDRFLSDWFGEDGRPSIPDRVTTLEFDIGHVRDQVTPNGGQTQLLADRIVRIEKQLETPGPCAYLRDKE